MKPVLALAVLVASTALAAEDSLQHAYPPGSIATREQAAAALEAARTRADEVGRTYATESAGCANVVFVTRCQDQARDKHRTAMREVDRVQREARELTRRLDAEERAQERAKDEARRAAEESGRAEREAKSREAYEARQREAEQRPPHAPGAAKPPPEPAAKAPRLTEAERAENVWRLQEKQRAAEEYAKRKAVEREENARRRDKRRQERQAREKESAQGAAAK